MSIVKRALNLPSLVFLFWAFVLTFPAGLAGSNSYMRIYDNATFSIPAGIAYANNHGVELRSLWCRFMDCGVDRLAALQAAQADILLFLFLPPWLAYFAMLLVQRFLAGYFAYRLFTDRLALSPVAAYCSAAFYSVFFQRLVNGSDLGFNYYEFLGYPAVPLYLWALTGLAAKRWRIGVPVAILLGTVLGSMSVYALSIFLFPLFLIWTYFVSTELRKRFLCLLICFGLGWLVAESPTLVPSVILARSSHRASRILYTFANVNWTSFAYTLHLLRYFAVDNVLALLFGLAAFCFPKNPDRARLRYTLGALACVCLFFMIRVPLFATIERAIPLGPVKGFSFDRMVYMAPFLAATLMAFGMNILLGLQQSTRPIENGHGRRWLVTMVTCAGILWPLGIGARILRIQFLDRALGESYATIFQNPEMQYLQAQTAKEPPFRVATVILETETRASYDTIWTNYAQAYLFESADGYLNLFPMEYLNYWTWLHRRTSATILTSASNTKNRLALILATSSRDWLARPEEERKSFSDLFDLNLLAAANVRYIISSIPMHDRNLGLVIASPRSDKEPGSTFFQALADFFRGKPAPHMTIYIYENRLAVPRCYVPSRIEFKDSQAKILEALSSLEEQSLRSRAFLLAENSETSNPISNSDAGQAAITEYSGDEVRVEADLPQTGYLIMVTSFNPFWEARVDGKRQKVKKANGAFMAVEVPAGKHQVTWQYRPPWKLWGD